MSDGTGVCLDEERTRRLEAQLAAITARVYELEREIAVLRGAPALRTTTSNRLPAANTQVAAVMPPSGSAPAAAASVPISAPAPFMPSAAGQEARSLEARVGSQWFNRIGIIAMLIGVAWFLKYAFDQHWVGPMGRVIIGLLGGAALIAWSERFRAKGYTAFSYSLKAVGTGVLYLSLWAAFSLYHLIPPGVAFAGMVLVTALNAFIAWRQSAELLAVYAIVGAFSTPLLLSTGQNDEVFLFSYLLMMNAATMALLVLRGWNRLLVLSFLGTVAFFWGWYLRWYAPAEFVTTAIFLSLFVLLFAAATVIAGRVRGRPAQDDAARALVSMANAAFGFLGFYAMLSYNGIGRNTALAWCAVGFGAFYLGIRKWMERAPGADTRWASLPDVQLAIAIVFLTLAVPLAVHGNWITIGWMAEGAVLVWVATRSQARLMQVLAVAALALGLISLAMDATAGQSRVIWNTRSLTFAVSIAALAVSAWLARKRTGERSWQTLSAACAVTAQLLVMITGLLEIHTYWWSGAPAGQYGAKSLVVSNTLLTSSMWLALLGVAAQWIAVKRLIGRPEPSLDGLLLLAAGILLVGCAVLVLFPGLDAPRHTVLLNLRFSTFLVVIAALWATVRLSDRAVPRAHLTRYAYLAANVLAVIAVCFEISTYWASRALTAQPGSALYESLTSGHHMAERFSYSAWFLIAGSLLLAAGFRRGSPWLRWQGLALLAVTIFKVFLLDTRSLSQGYHIVSFLALGALLLGVSFAYQRDWLKLRAATTGEEE